MRLFWDVGCLGVGGEGLRMFGECSVWGVKRSGSRGVWRGFKMVGVFRDSRVGLV